MTGTVLVDRYLLGAVVGRGGMGLVHEAIDLKLQRSVAVKLLGTASPDGESLRRFSREALAAGSLSHPNVVGVFDAGEQEGRPFLVTELLRGETLRQVLQRGKPELSQALSWAKQLVAGLSAAHERGLTHRDLKPSNIFITSDGWVKILDFGLAQLTSSEASLRVVGTVGYMAPEQVRGQPVDARADLFNFGLVLHELLSGKRAFAGASATEVSYGIVAGEPSPLPATVPPALRKLVARCLAKDREQRPATALEILAALSAKPSPRRRWALLALPVLAVAAGLALLAHRVLAVTPQGTVAILPFDGREVPRWEALADGVGDLIGRDLEAGPLRPIDQESIRHAAVGEAGMEISKARAAGLKLSAKYLVLGRVRERAGELFLDATLYDTETSRALAKASARGQPSRLSRMMLEIATQLEGRALPGPRFEERLAAAEAQLTGSSQALLAWLEGVHAWRAAQIDEATAAFAKALQADPQFALAQVDQGWLVLYLKPDVSEKALQAALVNEARLRPSERTLARHFLLRLQGDFAGAEKLLVSALRERPEDAGIWRLATTWFPTRANLLGHSPQEGLSALQHVLEFDPMDDDALGGLIDLAMLRGERPVVVSLTDRMLSLGDADLWSSVLTHLSRAWARSDPAEHDEALAALRKPKVNRYILVRALLQSATHGDGSPDLRVIAGLAPPGPGLAPTATADLLTGHISEARRHLEELAAARPGGDDAYYALWIDTLPLVALSPAQLRKSRAAAAQLKVSDALLREPARRYLQGLLALRAYDLAAAEEAVRALAALPEIPSSTIAADLTLALQARLLAARGDAAAALAALDQQKLRVPERYFRFYSYARDRFFRASLLVAVGRPREALPLYEALAIYELHDAALYPASNFYQARIHDALGEKESAIAGYERFVAMWKEADPEQQAPVREAQERLSVLRGQR
jgi:TolB-like protein